MVDSTVSRQKQLTLVIRAIMVLARNPDAVFVMNWYEKNSANRFRINETPEKNSENLTSVILVFSTRNSLRSNPFSP